MRLTQGTFSFLPDLTDEQIRKQIEYALEQGLGARHRVHGRPASAQHVLGNVGPADVRPARRGRRDAGSARVPAGQPEHYIRINAFDVERGFETVRLSFIVQRPTKEPGFRLERTEEQGRNIRYTLHSYATDQPVRQSLRRVGIAS